MFGADLADHRRCGRCALIGPIDLRHRDLGISSKPRHLRQLWDVTGTPVKLTETVADVADGSFFSEPSLALSWVVPITSPGGYQNFALELNIGSSGGDGYTILSHNLTVMYFPRQNN